MVACIFWQITLRAPSKTANDITLQQHENVVKDTSVMFQVMVNSNSKLVNLFGIG